MINEDTGAVVVTTGVTVDTGVVVAPNLNPTDGTAVVVTVLGVANDTAAVVVGGLLNVNMAAVGELKPVEETVLVVTGAIVGTNAIVGTVVSLGVISTGFADSLLASAIKGTVFALANLTSACFSTVVTGKLFSFTAGFTVSTTSFAFSCSSSLSSKSPAKHFNISANLFFSTVRFSSNFVASAGLLSCGFTNGFRPQSSSSYSSSVLSSLSFRFCLGIVS